MASEIPDGNVRIFNVVPITNPFVPDTSKLEPIDRKNYKIWSDKMELFLGQIGVDYCLSAVAAPENSVRDFVKDNKTSTLYMIYSKSKNAKDI